MADRAGHSAWALLGVAILAVLLLVSDFLFSALLARRRHAAIGALIVGTWCVAPSSGAGAATRPAGA